MARTYFMHSPRLGFGLWEPNDGDLAMGLWGDPRVTRLIGGPFSDQQVHDRLAKENATLATHGIQYWPLFRLADDVPVGCCGLRPYPSQEGVLELGFHLRFDYWGQGYGFEAAQCAIQYAFTTLCIRGLFAGHHPQNAASRTLLVRLGFRYTHDAFYAPTGLFHPSYLLMAADFAPAG